MTDVEVKEAVRERDGYRCIHCGITAEAHLELTGKTLEVHRLTPGAPYTVEGCVTLCKACHTRQPKSPPGSGPYRSSKLVSIPRDLHAMFLALAELNGSPVHWEIRTALVNHLKANGIRPDAILSLTARNATTVTQEVNRAVRELLAREGLWPPKDTG